MNVVFREPWTWPNTLRVVSIIVPPAKGPQGKFRQASGLRELEKHMAMTPSFLKISFPVFGGRNFFVRWADNKGAILAAQLLQAAGAPTGAATDLGFRDYYALGLATVPG